MRYQYWLCIVALLLSVVDPMTFNLDSSEDPIVMILQKSRPSLVVLPHNEKVIINLSRRRFWSIDTSGKDPTLTFGRLPANESGPQSKSPSPPKKTDALQKVSLVGTYKLSPNDMHNLSHALPIKINQTHISYEICSQNQCGYQHSGSSFEIGVCTLKQRPSCPPFSKLFYQDLQFAVHLQLIKTVHAKGKALQFRDGAGAQRLMIQKM